VNPAPVAKAAATKPAIAEPAVAEPAVAKATIAKATVAKAAPAPKAAPAAKPAAAEPAPAPAASDPGAVDAAPRVRPTPHKRVPGTQAAVAGSVPLTDVVLLGTVETADTADVVVVRKDVPVDPPSDSSPAGRLPLFLRRRPPLVRRRPALYLTAALVGALGLSLVSAEGPTAQATATMSSSVSVAEQLGIEAAPADIVDADATAQLGELAASRSTRDAEQAAAMQLQAEADRLAAEAAAEAARPDAVLPVQGARLTSTFGARWGTLHAGIDLAAPMHTPEYAAMDGVVLEAGPASGFGLAVYIQHENGDVTVYGHMDEILVEAGQVVRAGDTIALLGNRGQSTGPHLHFEVHVGGLDGQKIDPLPWLRDKGVDI
jgi:murein DD-endopeptidase MepM/ murein hydrolase activator NlpD